MTDVLYAIINSKGDAVCVRIPEEHQFWEWMSSHYPLSAQMIDRVYPVMADEGFPEAGTDEELVAFITDACCDEATKALVLRMDGSGGYKVSITELARKVGLKTGDHAMVTLRRIRRWTARSLRGT